jgi:shikimate dehydrogenase
MTSAARYAAGRQGGNVRAASASTADVLEEHLARESRGVRADIRVGLVGRGIQQSRTPFMHEAEGRRLGLAYAYSLLDFDALGLPDSALSEVVDAAADLGFAGLNVTHPFKQAVLACTTRLASEAEAIGAVNTVVCADGRRTGHNTDSWGFAESFRAGMAGASLDSVSLFGAGGGGAAVAHALMALGADRLAIVDGDAARAGALAARLQAGFAGRVTAASDAAAAVGDSTGIVNATPVGMAKYPGTPFPASLLDPAQWVADIIYFPRETELLRAARATGCRVLPGEGMAVYQAVRAFELFTGTAPDRAAMALHFEAAA